MLHIEITGETSPREWRAIATLAAAMLGEPTAPSIAPAPIPVEPESPVMPEVVAMEAAPMPAPPPLAAIAPDGVSTDNTGLPWDIRIHASTKVLTEKGEWRRKRGVDENLVRHVEAELRQVMAAPAPPILDPAAAFGSTTTTPSVVPPPPADVPETPAPVPLSEFARIMRIVSEKQVSGAVTTEMVVGIARQLGLTGVADLVKRPDLIPAFEALLP